MRPRSWLPWMSRTQITSATRSLNIAGLFGPATIQLHRDRLTFSTASVASLTAPGRNVLLFGDSHSGMVISHAGIMQPADVILAPPFGAWSHRSWCIRKIRERACTSHVPSDDGTRISLRTTNSSPAFTDLPNQPYVHEHLAWSLLGSHLRRDCCIAAMARPPCEYILRNGDYALTLACRRVRGQRPAFGRTCGEQHYSPLDQINEGNRWPFASKCGRRIADLAGVGCGALDGIDYLMQRHRVAEAGRGPGAQSNVLPNQGIDAGDIARDRVFWPTLIGRNGWF